MEFVFLMAEQKGRQGRKKERERGKKEWREGERKGKRYNILCRIKYMREKGCSVKNIGVCHPH